LGQTLRKKAEETHISSAFVLSNAFCKAKSYLNLPKATSLGASPHHLRQRRNIITAKPYIICGKAAT
jgi:hypothetical protein